MTIQQKSHIHTHCIVELNLNNIIHQELMTCQVNLSGFSHQVIAIQCFLETQKVNGCYYFRLCCFLLFFFLILLVLAFCLTFHVNLTNYGYGSNFHLSPELTLSLSGEGRCVVGLKLQGQCCYRLPRVASKKTACFCGVM